MRNRGTFVSGKAPQGPVWFHSITVIKYRTVLSPPKEFPYPLIITPHSPPPAEEGSKALFIIKEMEAWRLVQG